PRRRGAPHPRRWWDRPATPPPPAPCRRRPPLLPACTVQSLSLLGLRRRLEELVERPDIAGAQAVEADADAAHVTLFQLQPAHLTLDLHRFVLHGNAELQRRFRLDEHSTEADVAGMGGERRSFVHDIDGDATLVPTVGPAMLHHT